MLPHRPPAPAFAPFPTLIESTTVFTVDRVAESYGLKDLSAVDRESELLGYCVHVLRFLCSALKKRDRHGVVLLLFDGVGATTGHGKANPTSKWEAPTNTTIWNILRGIYSTVEYGSAAQLLTAPVSRIGVHARSDATSTVHCELICSKLKHHCAQHTAARVLRLHVFVHIHTNPTFFWRTRSPSSTSACQPTAQVDREIVRGKVGTTAEEGTRTCPLPCRGDEQGQSEGSGDNETSPETAASVLHLNCFAARKV